MIKSFVLFLVSLSFISCATSRHSLKSSESFGAVAIMQGATSQTQADFVVAVPINESVQVELLDHDTDKVLLKALAKDIRFENSEWKLVQFRISQLSAGQNYKLRVMGEKGNWSDLREFHTFKNNPHELYLSIISCMKDNLPHFEKIWDDLRDEKPQAVFMIGDNTYADLNIKTLLFKMTPEKLWERHMETRNKLPIFRWQKLVPVFATWDDHDYGVNGGDSTFKYKVQSAKIFHQFFPMNLSSASLLQGPGIARALKWGEHQFFFLDNRSFRSPSTSSAQKVHFGKQQTQWIMKNMDSNKLNWLLSGDQFFGAYHPFDSFQGQYNKAFVRFISRLKKTRSPVLLVSGDRHMSEIMKLPVSYFGYQTYELTSSPIHSTVYPGSSQKHNNPYQIATVDGQWNFMMLDLQTDKDHYVIDVKAEGQGQKVFFEKHLKVQKAL